MTKLEDLLKALCYVMQISYLGNIPKYPVFDLNSTKFAHMEKLQ